MGIFDNLSSELASNPDGAQARYFYRLAKRAAGQ